MTLLIRIGLAVSLAVSAASHAYLYVHGYRHIPDIGAAFLVQASALFAIALLVLLGGPEWLRWAAAAVAAGSLVAFTLSRTVGLQGFVERGWEPSPHAAITVTAELLTVLLWVGELAARRDRQPRESGRRPLRRRGGVPPSRTVNDVP